MNKIKILYLDEEQNNLNAFTAYFRRKEAFCPISSLTSIDAEKYLADYINVLIIDHSILEDVGLDFCLRPALENTIIIAVTARRNFEMLELAVSQGIVFSYHCKPFDFDDLFKSIEEAIKCSNANTMAN